MNFFKRCLYTEKTYWGTLDLVNAAIQHIYIYMGAKEKSCMTSNKVRPTLPTPIGPPWGKLPKRIRG